MYETVLGNESDYEFFSDEDSFFSYNTTLASEDVYDARSDKSSIYTQSYKRIKKRRNRLRLLRNVSSDWSDSDDEKSDSRGRRFLNRFTASDTELNGDHFGNVIQPKRKANVPPRLPIPENRRSRRLNKSTENKNNFIKKVNKSSFLPFNLFFSFPKAFCQKKNFILLLHVCFYK